VRNQCRPKIYTHDEGFYYYYLSFRCCAEPDGAETDPRTPKQRRAGDTMKKVERTAGISVQEMKALLEKKKTDPTCGCKTTRCKTYCGTLLDDEKAASKDLNDHH
jgi:formylglycine-generating enzyme